MKLTPDQFANLVSLGGFDQDEDVPENIEIVTGDITIKLDAWLSERVSIAVAVLDKASDLLMQHPNSTSTFTHIFGEQEYSFRWQIELQNDKSVILQVSHEETAVAR